MNHRKQRTLSILAIFALVAAPAAADAIAGCAIPLIPLPERLIERSWDARGLVMFIQERGVVELRGEPGQVMEVQPKFALLTSNGRETLAKGAGDRVKGEVGRHRIGEIADGIFEQMSEALMNLAGNSTRLEVLAVQTLEHDQAPKYPPEHGAVALTLEYVNPSGHGAPATSHKLVLFLLPAVQKGR